MEQSQTSVKERKVFFNQFVESLKKSLDKRSYESSENYYYPTSRVISDDAVLTCELIDTRKDWCITNVSRFIRLNTANGSRTNEFILSHDDKSITIENSTSRSTTFIFYDKMTYLISIMLLLRSFDYTVYKTYNRDFSSNKYSVDDEHMIILDSNDVTSYTNMTYKKLMEHSKV